MDCQFPRGLRVYSVGNFERKEGKGLGLQSILNQPETKEYQRDEETREVGKTYLGKGDQVSKLCSRVYVC